MSNGDGVSSLQPHCKIDQSGKEEEETSFRRPELNMHGVVHGALRMRVRVFTIQCAMRPGGRQVTDSLLVWPVGDGWC
jgi:hypothetical protein